MVKDIDVKALADTRRLRQLLERIKRRGDRYILKEDGQPKAALLSLEDLEFLEKAKADEEKRWDALFKGLRKVHSQNVHVSAEEVDADVDEVIQAVRQSRLILSRPGRSEP